MSVLDRTVSILGDLIAFPSVSSESNLALIQHISAYLEEAGAEVRVYSDASGAKANLFATLGPARDGGIVLSGHSDVVPVTGQDWSTDPFAMTEQEGRLFGRGTCDMKGFIAASLAMVPDFAAAELQRPVHFAFTHDEETGCLGARSLVQELKKLPFKPALAIIGEPTEMRVIEGHKGCCEYSVEFTGLEGHGSMPHLGVNAVEYAVRYVAKLMDLREELQRRVPPNSRYEPPWTTIQVGRLAGGVIHNIIPNQCSLDWEMRPVQDSDFDYVKREITRYVDEELRPEMKKVHEAADIATQIIGEVDGLDPMEESAAVRLVSELTGANGTDLVAFGTEAGLFQDLGISTVVCGPGSIEQAHKPDEYVSLDQLGQSLKMLEGLIPKLEAA